MTFFDVAVVGIALGIAGSLYGFLIHERHKLRMDRRAHPRGIHPAE